MTALEGCVLVTGGAGFIGSHTVRHLEDSGVACVVVDNLSAGHREAVTAELCEVDLADRDGLDEVFRKHRPRSVIHFAAKCYVGESVHHPALYYRENVVHTWNLLEAMRKHDCEEIVFSSSCATYGEPLELPLTEDHPQNPISPYGRTKLHMEHMIRDYRRAYGFRIAALRYFNAAGAHPDGTLGEDHDPETHLLPLVIDVALGRREKILIFGDDYETADGTCIRDYIHVLDLADAHARALSALQAGEEEILVNLGTGLGSSVREVVDSVQKVTGQAVRSEIVERREGDPAILVSGGRRARSLLGWEPEVRDLDTIVEHSWRFRRDHPSGYV